MAKKTAKKKTKSVAKKQAKSAAKPAPRKTAKKATPRPATKPRPPKGPVWQWSAMDTAAAIRAGAVSSVEVVEAHLARMRAVNPKLNAVVVDLSEEALKAAKAADGAAARRNAGLLHGVPITIKENADYAGRPNPNGVPAQMSIIAPSDAPVVRNLKNAGAIVIGLTNTPEFSFRGFTDNPLHGLTLNPWDPDITCGGSSGGAGSAVAAGIGAIAHGNDIGGSLRWPAHCNGVATIKPTQGRIPAYNESAAAERPMLAHLMSAQGPLARSVADVRLALEVMSARDPRDPWWVPAPLAGPKPKGPIKVALAKLPDDMKVDPSVHAALRTAADHLERSGYRVSEVEVPDINGVWHTLVRHHHQRNRDVAGSRDAQGGVGRFPHCLERHQVDGQYAGPRGLDARDRRPQQPYPRLADVLRRISGGAGADDRCSRRRARARTRSAANARRRSSGTTCASFPRSTCSACHPRWCRSRCIRASRSACS